MIVLTQLLQGGSCTPDHVVSLAREVQRQLRFYDRCLCLTDVPGLSRMEYDIQCIPMAHRFPDGWAKIELFRPMFQEQERIFYFDPDVVITDDLRVAAKLEQRLVLAAGYAMSVAIWTAGDLFPAYRDFVRAPQKAQETSGVDGLAEWLRLKAPTAQFWRDLLPAVPWQVAAA